MRIVRSVFFAVMLLASIAAHAAEADAILGTWSTANDDSKVEIAKNGDTYYGRIISLKEPNYPTDPNAKHYVQGLENQPKVDRHNPDESLRSRPIVGMELMRGFKYEGDNRWAGGTIYDPESGKTYKCKMTLVAPNKLKVRGFIGVSLFGRTTTWTR